MYYLSFKEAAEKRCLLKSNESITECLIETTIYQMLKVLQKLFVIILYHCEASNVRKLCDRFFEAMFEDFKRIYEDEYFLSSRSIHFLMIY